MKVVVFQLNPLVGDLEENSSKILLLAKKLPKGIDLIITPELALLGYPPRDLLLYPDLILKAEVILKKLAHQIIKLPPLLVGTAIINENKNGRSLFNTAVLLKEGEIAGIFYKSLLPTYDVFDEDRYFESVKEPQILKLNDKKVGISICEDLWNDKDFWQRSRYNFDPIERLAKEKIDLIVNLSASPFTLEKQKLREKMIASSARKYHVPIVYVNQVGGNDDLIFDGASLIFDSKGQLIARAKAFQEDCLMVDLKRPGKQINPYPFQSEEVFFEALKLGLSDYVKKCSFKKVILGISGGIDSALTATIAANALGPKNVLGILMSSPFTSNQSIIDAKKLASNLKIKTIIINIEKIMDSYENSLKYSFRGYRKNVTEQNIQARIRGNLLMALANKYNALVLATGNKSEFTVGYSTIYGDMVGGLAPIGDLTKTQVYNLARWINREEEIIPEKILTKAPTAELAPNQKDQDDLPPYDLLDQVLELHIEKQLGAKEIISKGYKTGLVKKVLSMVKKAEFKRRQAPLSLKVTGRAYGSGWRMPIAASQKIF